MKAGLVTGSLSAMEIAEILEAELIGDPNRCVTDVDVVDRATECHLSFVGDTQNLPRLRSSQTRVVIGPHAIRNELSGYPDRTFLLVPEAEVAFLSVAALLKPSRPRLRIGVSVRAVVDPTASIGSNTNVHPLAVIGRDVQVGQSCEIHSGVVIGDGCRIGDNVTIHPNTVLYHDIEVGSHVIIHASCVIGADGFGYRFVNGGHERLPHFGTVRICDDVEIGAGTTIDRAKVGETLIGTGTRIDNQVMIAHNCRVGRHNLLVSQVGFAGSVSTGDYVVCAGQVGIADHVRLGDGAVIGAKAGVHRDLPGGQTYLGTPAGPAIETTKQLMALRRLPEIRDTVRRLEKELENLRSRLTDPAVPEWPSPGAAAA